MPEVPGLGEGNPRKIEQWGATKDAPDEGYRLLCHRGQSPEEKVFDRLSRDAKYIGVVHFVFENFACAGSQTRHMFSEPYNGDPDNRSTMTNNQIPDQLDQVLAFLGDQSARTAAARTFLAKEGVAPEPVPAVDASPPHIDALYFSAGGNDIGFGDTIMRCAIFPLPDCGDGTNGTTRQLQRYQSGGDGNLQDVVSPDTLPDADNFYPGLESLPGSYSSFDSALRNAFVVRGSQSARVTPSAVYTAEGPNPLRKDANTLCNGSEGPLHDDVLGLLSPTDVRFADKMANDLNDAIDSGATKSNAVPFADGRDKWTLVPNRDAFVGHAICTDSRFTQTGADALAATGNDLGQDAIFEASDGTMHPNDKGYEKLADDLEPLIRKQVDDMIAAFPVQPTRLRLVSAVQGGAIGVRWDDTANNDSFSEVLVRPSGTTGPFRTARGMLPVDSTSYTLDATQPTTDEFEIKVCTRFGKCATSDPIVATNEPPTIPTGLTAGLTRSPATKVPNGLNVTWNSVPKNLSVSVVVRVQSPGSDTVTDFPVDGNGEPPVAQFSLGLSALQSGTYTVRVRGCNVLGCTATGDAITADVIGLIAPTTLVPERGATPNGNPIPPTTKLP